MSQRLAVIGDVFVLSLLVVLDLRGAQKQSLCYVGEGGPGGGVIFIGFFFIFKFLKIK